jgi:trigger factor
LKIEKELLDNCIAKLTVQVDDEQVQPALKAAARKISKQYKIPGFRPGKAPYEVVLRQFGEDMLYQNAVDELGQKVYEAALDQEKLDAYATGSLDDIQLKPMVLKFTVPLRPEVELGDHRALRLPYAAPGVTDEAVQDAVEHLREHQAVLDPVERPAALGDVAALDVKAFLNTGENPSDFLMADEDVTFLMDEKGTWPMPGFAPMVVGLQAGDEKKFDLTFPDDYSNTSLRGQTAHCEVKVKEVKNRSLPEWSDELAKSMGDYESLADLRQKVRAELEARARASVDDEYRSKAVDALVDQAQIKYPPMLLQQELDGVVEDYDRRLREQRLTLDDYLKIEKKTKEQFREEQLPTAERRLKRALVLGKIVELERLTVSDEDVDAEIDAFVQLVGAAGENMRKSLSNRNSRNALAVDLITGKAVRRVADIAKGEDIPLPEPEAKVEAAAEAAAE